MIRIAPYKISSKAARTLKKALNAKWVISEKDYYPNDLVLYIGNHKQGVFGKYTLNASTSDAINKLTTFKLLADYGVSIPEFTADKYTALSWINPNKAGVAGLARTLLRASQGRGIVPFYHNEDYTTNEFPNAPLYVKYIKKSAEYRVHIFNNKVIRVQEKRRRRSVEASNIIRNLANGWVFCTQDVTLHEGILKEALNAVKALGLDFGAVDIIWNKYYSKAYVLEVNTAPAMQGTTLTKYIAAIKEYYNEVC